MLGVTVRRKWWMWCEREEAVTDVGGEWAGNNGLIMMGASMSRQWWFNHVGCEREKAVTDVGGVWAGNNGLIMMGASMSRQWWFDHVGYEREEAVMDVGGECEQAIMVQSRRGWVWAGNDGSIMFGASIIIDTLCKLSYHTHDITYMHLRARSTFSTVVLPLAPCTLSTSILPAKHSIPTQQLTRFPWTWLLGYRCSLGALLLSCSTYM